MNEKMIRDAYVKIRTIDNTIPDDVLDFMKNAALDKLKHKSNINNKYVKTNCNQYDIMSNENGPEQKFIFEWYDTIGKYHLVETKDMDEAQTLLGLLSGDICLGDLES